ncbi:MULTISPECIES: hypothetical protein [Stutzerimonas stutzeri subgroup]|jgi:hypothetical protein|uniref:hypothetical protein n=1 Tax=Stutzerimonas stutzeri subgroup TaxID=578833 RepID=UPI001746B1B7|nr:hypothetical protein [Stutzerimonas kunmingensis]MBD3876111.1 hypothetical protein [Stutzerimonas kunmingensis]|tara:strand:+ start:4451 stop:4627 length:177 start_codon:yes stop_codon:yes gene_type:complete
MRTHLNDRSKDELIAVMQALGFTSTNHTLNVIITQAYKQIVLNSQREVNTNEQQSSQH